MPSDGFKWNIYTFVSTLSCVVVPVRNTEYRAQTTRPTQPYALVAPSVVLVGLVALDQELLGPLKRLIKENHVVTYSLSPTRGPECTVHTSMEPLLPSTPSSVLVRVHSVTRTHLWYVYCNRTSQMFQTQYQSLDRMLNAFIHIFTSVSPTVKNGVNK